MLNQFTASLWGDEAFSAVLSTNTVKKIIEIVSRDTSPPLYNLTLHFWYQLFGTSEIAIRCLSFFYFILAVFFVYLIGTLLFNKKTGFWAAVLTFLNPFFFIYAFEGRMYSILALGVTASMYFFIKRNWIGYVIATTWALYSHHFAIFAVIIQGFYFLFEFLRGQKRMARNIFKSFLAIGVLYSPWLIPLYKQTKMVGGGFWLSKPNFTNFLEILAKYLATGISNNHLVIPFTNLPLYKISFLLVDIVLLTRNWFKEFKKTSILLAWFLGPILLAYAISQKFQSIFFDRYLLYTIPAAMLILASNKNKYSGKILLILIATLAIIDFNYFIHPTKRLFKELAAYVKSNRSENDLILNWNSEAHHLWESKYYQIPAPLYIPEGDLPYYVGTAQMTKDDILRELPKNVKRIGVITSGNVAEIKLPDYTEKEIVNFGELKFVWYQK